MHFCLYQQSFVFKVMMNVFTRAIRNHTIYYSQTGSMTISRMFIMQSKTTSWCCKKYFTIQRDPLQFYFIFFLRVKMVLRIQKRSYCVQQLPHYIL